MKPAYILAAYRTPGCKANKGKFKSFRPDQLAALAMKGLLERAKVDPAQIEDVILGCAFPEGEQGMNVARIAQLAAGIPNTTTAWTINRFCSSGLQSIATAADRVRLGEADCILAGGVESMSMVPMGGNKYSANPDLALSMPEAYVSMGLTAEMVAEKYGIDRQSMDQFATESHHKAAKAIEEGRFTDEIIPVEIDTANFDGKKMIKGTEIISIDDGVRADTSVEGLAKLRPAFKQTGSVTAGNSSQMTDGAAAALVVSEEFLKQTKLAPMAQFLGFRVTGCPPEIMGIGPVKAIPAALKLTGLKLEQLGLIELNEAFAAQSLAVIKELGLDRSILNVNGGAIAMGHPLGCTGAKLTATLLHQMKRTSTRYGMVSMCIGGGMGAAGIFELIQ